MPRGAVPQSDTDWNTVTYLKKKPTKSDSTSSKAVIEAQRSGATIDTTKKFSSATNRQHSAAKNTAHLDAESEELHHATVSLSLGRLIQQTRQTKEMTQKDLAQKINEKPNVINEYESGKAIPNQQILSKLEHVLGTYLRGKNMGQPLAPKAPAAKKK